MPTRFDQEELLLILDSVSLNLEDIDECLKDDPESVNLMNLKLSLEQLSKRIWRYCESKEGTPNTLIEAIGEGQIQTRDYSDSQELLAIKKRVKDFMSQHFTRAVLEHPESETMLLNLFNRITK